MVLIRTGWHHLADDPDTYEHYLATEPGIFVREARFFADRRPALVGAERGRSRSSGPPTSRGRWPFPSTRSLPGQEPGIRIGEGIISSGLAEDGIHDFVYMYSPQYALGATAGNVPPVGLAKQR